MAARLGVDALTFCTPEGNISGQITKDGIEDIDLNADEVTAPVGTFATVNAGALTATGTVNLQGTTNAATLNITTSNPATENVTTLNAGEIIVSTGIRGLNPPLSVGVMMIGTHAEQVPFKAFSYYANARAELPSYELYAPTQPIGTGVTDPTWNLFVTDDLVTRSEGGKFAFVGPTLASFPAAGRLLTLGRSASAGVPATNNFFIDLDDLGNVEIKSSNNYLVFLDVAPVIHLGIENFVTVGATVGAQSLTLTSADVTPSPTSVDVRITNKRLSSTYREITLFFVNGITVTRTNTANPTILEFITLNPDLRPDYQCSTCVRAAGSWNDGALWHYDYGVADIRVETNGTLGYYQGASHTAFLPFYTYVVAPFSITYTLYHV
jgi:hypothetical protein